MEKANSTAPNGDVSAEFYSAIIESIGSATFFADIAEIVARHLPFQGLIVFLYGKHSAPTALGCFGNALEFQSGLKNYLRFTYVLNPVYRAFQDNIAADAYLINNLMPAGYTQKIANSDLRIRIDDKETIGYRTPGWPKSMTDVLGLVYLPDKRMIEFDFITSQSGDQTARCFAGLKLIYPVLSSALLKHFEYAAQDFDTSDATPSLESRFQEFGHSILTNREQAVVKMVLTGHSSNSIALNLGISLPTVKTHRRNIYSKLDISSQAELFNLFVQDLLEGTGSAA